MKTLRSKSLFLVLFISLLSVVSFNGRASSVSVTRLTPASPATLYFGNQVTIAFNYNITTPRGARIFIRPISGTRQTPNYSASGSPIYKGKGNANATFTITAGQTKVTQLRIQIYNDNQSQLLFEFYFPVEYTFTNKPISITLSKQATGQLQTIHNIQKVPKEQTMPANESTDQQENQPLKKKILPDGKIEITYPNGRIETRYNGGRTVYDPVTGQTMTYAFSTQARAVIPPSLPEGEELVWMEIHSENLHRLLKHLSILTMLPLRTIFNQKETRTFTTRSLHAKRQLVI
ncbi:MAG: hypothetical protein ACK5M7_21350 [Draconibacterium sp.]